MTSKNNSQYNARISPRSSGGGYLRFCVRVPPKSMKALDLELGDKVEITIKKAEA